MIEMVTQEEITILTDYYFNLYARREKKTEKEISRLEEENDQLKEEMALSENATNVAKLMELNTKLEENEAALLELYDKWEELSE